MACAAISPTVGLHVRFSPQADSFWCFGYGPIGPHWFMHDGDRCLPLPPSQVIESMPIPALLGTLRYGQTLRYLDAGGVGRFGTFASCDRRGVTSVHTQCDGQPMPVPLQHLRIPTAFHLLRAPTIVSTTEIEYTFSFGNIRIHASEDTAPTCEPPLAPPSSNRSSG